MAKRGLAPCPGVTVGLDISSVCVGFAVFHGSELHDYNKFYQIGTWHGEKLGNFLQWLISLFKQYKPEHVVIELPHGGGRGKAFEVLSQYVAIVLLAHYSVFGRELPQSHRLYPSQVKSYLKVPTTVNHDKNKAVMVDFINRLFKLKLQYSQNKKFSDDDIADAIALTAAWLVRSRRDDGRYDPEPDRARKRTKKASSGR